MTHPRNLARARDLLDRLVRSWPLSLAHARAITADGWPLRGDSAGVRTTTETSSVEAAALARTTGTGPGYRTADLVEEFEILMLQIAATADRLWDICVELAPPPGTPRRCSGGMGLAGHDEWGDPTCRNIPDGRPSRHGMCDACHQRRERWVRRVAA